jgi:hypothetical protein
MSKRDPFHSYECTQIPEREAPKQWDGFGFFKERAQGNVNFYFFDDTTRKHGELPGPVDVPEDRVAFHVLLTTTRKNRIHIEIPFTSCFLDVFVYAKRVAHMGFSGVMIKVNEFSGALAAATLHDAMAYHASEYGFVLENEQGEDIFYPGKKKEWKVKS